MFATLRTSHIALVKTSVTKNTLYQQLFVALLYIAPLTLAIYRGYHTAVFISARMSARASIIIVDRGLDIGADIKTAVR